MFRLQGGAEILVRIHDGTVPGRVDVEIVDPEGLPFYGTGASLGEAMGHLTAALIETMDHLERNTARLGPLPMNRLEKLRALFEPQIKGHRPSGTPSYPLGSDDTTNAPVRLTAA